jgi:integrase
MGHTAPPSAEWCRIQGTEIYRRYSTGTYYERPCVDGVHTFRSLKTKNQKSALAEWAKRHAARARGEDPQPKSPVGITVGACISLYQSAGCPDRHRQQRPALMRKAEEANCKRLLEFWGKTRVDDITVAKNDAYRDRRVKEVSRGSGDRTVDLELNTLRNALLWAARCELIRHMPPPTVWKRYRASGDVQHCRDSQPADAGELHRIARMMFEAGSKSEVIGWQILVEACTGLRTIDALALRWDAAPGEPGHVSADGKSLCVRRAKKKGHATATSSVLIHPDFEQVLTAFRGWHAKKYPAKPAAWYFPSPRASGQPLNKSAIIQALRRVSAAIGHRVTSHGMRAYYVTARRSWGIPDAQIGFEVGHRPGQTLAEVYGGVPPHWLAGDGPKLGWMPSGDPAWVKPPSVEDGSAQSKASPLLSNPTDPEDRASACAAVRPTALDPDTAATPNAHRVRGD